MCRISVFLMVNEMWFPYWLTGWWVGRHRRLRLLWLFPLCDALVVTKFRSNVNGRVVYAFVNMIRASHSRDSVCNKHFVGILFDCVWSCIPNFIPLQTHCACNPQIFACHFASLYEFDNNLCIIHNFFQPLAKKWYLWKIFNCRNRYGLLRSIDCE